MSEGVYGRLDARASIVQPSPSMVAAVPASVSTLPPHTNAKKYLDPAGQEFLPGGAAIGEIIDIIKRNCCGLYRCWNKVPQSIRDTWFKEFEKKYWWYPENYLKIRNLFVAHGRLQLHNQQSKLKNMEDWAAHKSKNKNKLNKNSKKEKYSPDIDEDQSSQSSMEDDIFDDSNNNYSRKLNIPGEVKVVMDTIGNEFHGKVKKSFEAVNRVWLQRVQSLERQRDELKHFVHLYAQYNATLKGMSDKLILKDNSLSPPQPPPPPHQPKAVSFRRPPLPPPPQPKLADSQPPPPAYNPKVPAFRPPPPQYHPNVTSFPTPPQPYHQPNFSALQPVTSGYGFQGKQPLGQGNGYSYKDYEDEDDDFSDEFSDY